MLLLGQSQRTAATSFLARSRGRATGRLRSAAEPGGANSARTVTLISTTSPPLPICTAQLSATAGRANATSQTAAINHGVRRIFLAPPVRDFTPVDRPNKLTIFQLDTENALLLRDAGMPSLAARLNGHSRRGAGRIAHLAIQARVVCWRC